MLTDSAHYVLRQLAKSGHDGRGHYLPTYFKTCPPRELVEAGLALETETHTDGAWFRITPAGKAALKESG